MALDEKSQTNKKKGTPSNPKEKKPKENKPPSKVIIRRLPPTMTEEVFLEQISPIPDNDFFYYVKGDIRVGVPTFSRAYINFVNQEDIFTFQDKFDGYIFLDQKGNEYTALVEFAPYQKIPRQDGGKEDKCNTLDDDPHYLEFLKKLENPEEVVLPNAEAYLEQIEQKEREMKANGKAKVNTPLVEFILQRRMDREKHREEKKEERRRKELEKKKQRDAERNNKKREGKANKDDKKQSEKPAAKAKQNKEDGRPPNPIKVLKNTERQVPDKVDGAEGGGGATSKRPPKDPSKSKEKSNKERPFKEPRPKSTRGPKPAPSDSAEGAPPKEKAEAPPSEHQQQQKKTPVKSNKDEGATGGDKDIPAKTKAAEEGRAPESERPPRRNDKDPDGKKLRNKDRPAIQIYRPGAKRLTTQKSTEESGGANSVTPPPNSEETGSSKREVKTRTFSRSSTSTANSNKE